MCSLPVSHPTQPPENEQALSNRRSVHMSVVAQTPAGAFQRQLPPLKVSPKPTPLLLKPVSAPGSASLQASPPLPQSSRKPLGGLATTSPLPVTEPTAERSTTAVVSAPIRQLASSPSSLLDDERAKTIEERLLSNSPIDTSSRHALVEELAAHRPAQAWSLYRKIRTSEMARCLSPQR